MRSGATIVVALAALAGAVPAQGDAPAAVDELLERWRAAPERSADGLARDLVEVGAAAEPHLRRLLLSGREPLATQPIATALARIGSSPESLGAIGRLLEAPDAALRIAGATALGEASSLGPLAPLLAALEDPIPAVRAAAAASLVRVARDHPGLDVQRWLRRQLAEQPRSGRGEVVLARITAEAVERRVDVAMQRVVQTLVDEWREGGSRPASDLVNRLLRIGPEAERVLIRRLGTASESDVVEPVALALIRLGPSADALAAVTGLLAAKEPRRRIAGVLALGQMSDEQTAARLIPMLDDSASDVRAAAARSLVTVCRKNPDYDVLVWHASEIRNLEHRDALAEFLGRNATAESRRLLLEFVDVFQDAETRLAGLHGLSLCGRADDAGEVQGVLLALAADEIVVRRKACLVAGTMKAKPAIRALIDCLDHDHRGLAANAHWALGQITGLRLAADPGLWEVWWERAGRHLVPSPAPR